MRDREFIDHKVSVRIFFVNVNRIEEGVTIFGVFNVAGAGVLRVCVSVFVSTNDATILFP